MSEPTIRVESKKRRVGTRPKSVTVKTLTTSKGDKVRVLSVDANSPTFSDDFLYVFTKNVRDARKENKRLLGTRSGVKRGD